MSKLLFIVGSILTLGRLVMPLPGCTDDIPDKTEYGTKACDDDDKCRGFVETSSKLPGGMADGCQYATTNTECAPGCEKLESDGMMTGADKLWPGENGFSGYCGCWIKKSMI